MDAGNKRFFEVAFYLSLPLAGFLINGLMGAGYTILVYLLLYALLTTLSRRSKYATTVKPGEIKFIVAGDSLVKVLTNLKGWHYEEDKQLIVKNESGYEPEYQFLITRYFGIYWMSIFYPGIGLKVYSFEWDQLIPGGHIDDDEGEHLVKLGVSGDYYSKHRDEEVDSIYWRYTYPVFAEQVELKDNFKVDVLVNITFQTLDPYMAVFIMEGKWLTQSTAAIKGAIADYGRGLPFNDFRDAKKQGIDSKLTQRIMAVNTEYEPVLGGGPPDPNNPNTERGIIKAFGVMVYKADFVKFDLSKGYEDVQEATTAVGVAELKATAVVAKSVGDATAITNIGNAKAGALDMLVPTDGHPDRASVLREQIRTEGLLGYKGNVLSLGAASGGVPVLVDASGKPQKPVDSKSGETSP